MEPELIYFDSYGGLNPDHIKASEFGVCFPFLLHEETINVFVFLDGI